MRKIEKKPPDKLTQLIVAVVSVMIFCMAILAAVLVFTGCTPQKKAVAATPTVADKIVNIMVDTNHPEIPDNSKTPQFELLPVHNSKNKLFLSNSTSTFQEFVTACILTGDTGVIDITIMVYSTVNVNGNLSLISTDGLLSSLVPITFLLGTGNHYFEGFDINQQEGATAFQTVFKNNILWNNTFNSVNIKGGKYGYYSARGGDSLHWCHTTFNNCSIKVETIGIAIYSQDGPYKSLHANNLFISTDSSHNLYIHPNVSLRLNNVHSVHVGTTSKGAGSTGLALHQYSGGGVPGKAKYIELTNCVTETDGGVWQIAKPGNDSIRMTGCEISLYSTPVEATKAISCKFLNGGNGAYFRGLAVNCSGMIWPVDGSVISGGSFDNVTLCSGNILVKNATIKYLSSRQAGLNTTFNNCQIETAYINYPGIVTFKKTALPKWKKTPLASIVIKK